MTMTIPDQVDLLEDRGELLVLPVGTILRGGLKRLSADEPAGLDWYFPGSPMGYSVGEIRLPTWIIESA